MDNYYYEIEGWFTDSDKVIYEAAVKKFNSGSVFVEVGSFKGRSSVAMAIEIINSGKDIKFYCVDTWEGSEEHQSGKSFEDKDVVEKKLYEKFLQNIEPIKHIITPIRKPSLEAVNYFENESVDFIFLDAAHDYENVKKDLNVWKSKVKKGGLLAGHDWTWETVRNAVEEFIKENNLQLITTNNVWGIKI